MRNFTSLVKATAYVVTLMSFTYCFGQKAGNVGSSLQLWMKANSGTSTTTNNGAVNSWLDNSPNGFTAFKGRF